VTTPDGSKESRESSRRPRSWFKSLRHRQIVFRPTASKLKCLRAAPACRRNGLSVAVRETRDYAIQRHHLLKVLRRFEQPPWSTAQELQRLELNREVLVVRGLVVGQVIIPSPRNVIERLERHRGEVVRHQLDLHVITGVNRSNSS
jgi:hypothetical protein